MTGTAKEYLIPDGLGPATFAEALPPSLSLRADSRSDGVRTYLDTFDGLLHRADLTLVHDDGRLAALDAAEDERAAVDWPEPPERLFATDLPDGRLRDLLAPLIDVRALTPIARVRGPRRVYRVLDDQQKTVVRLVLEEPRVAGERSGSLRSRLRAVGVRGYDKALARVGNTLEEQLGLTAVDVSLLDEAIAGTGGRPGGVSSKIDVKLEPEDRADRAAARLLRRLLEVIEANLPGTLTDVDSEFLHDLRVAVRRTRALQRELRDVFPADRLAHFRTEFKWLQAVTGPSRDLDVYLLDFDEFQAALPHERRADLEPLRGLLTDHRTRERRRMVRALRSDRTRKLLADWGEFLAHLDESDQAIEPGGERPISDLAGARIAKVFRKMVKAGSAIDDSSPPVALHDLRKQGKELRYLLEFFASLYPGKVVKPMVRTLKALQDTLGRFQDREVQAHLLSSLRDEVRSLDDGAAALMAMGQLVDRLEQQQAAARDEFAERFAAFASSEQRALVKETFK